MTNNQQKLPENVKELGNGRMAKTPIYHQCSDPRSRKSFDQMVESWLAKELEILELLQPHPNIIKVFSDESTPTSIVLERCHHDLFDEFERSTKSWTGWQQAMRDLIVGLQYVHEHRIAHFDIKPENLLWSEDSQVWKICDFGAARGTDAQGMCFDTSNCTVAYAAPECTRNETRRINGFMADVWSVATTLFNIASRCCAEVRNPVRRREWLQNDLGELAQVYRKDFCPRAGLKDYSVFKRCFATEPHLRPKLAELLAVLPSPPSLPSLPSPPSFPSA